jgi:ADP-ribose pyrophosphatase YjhB (NUDIX family)
MPPAIRTLSVAVCFSGDRLLVERGHDRVEDRRYYRAIGGGVEFGERAVEALRREWREELALELEAVRLLGVLENLFTYEGRPGHEIVFVHAAQPADAWAYARDEWQVIDSDGVAHTAAWVTPEDLRERPLYPTGLLELLPVDRPPLEFGVREPGAEYVLRPRGHAVIFAGDDVAVLAAPAGPVLPCCEQGPGEAPEQAAIRATVEACGRQLAFGPAIGVVDELVCAADGHVRWRCSFFVAEVVGERPPLTWMPAQVAARTLRHASQRWAVAEAFRRRDPPRR